MAATFWLLDAPDSLAKQSHRTHNGVVQGLDRLDARLAELGVADLVLGQTDSERVFALITAEIAAHTEDVDAGISAAIGWIAEHRFPRFARARADPCRSATGEGGVADCGSMSCAVDGFARPHGVIAATRARPVAASGAVTASSAASRQRCAVHAARCRATGASIGGAIDRLDTPSPASTGAVVARLRCRAGLSVDHRVADGAAAARLLARMQRLCDDPPALR